MILLRKVLDYGLNPNARNYDQRTALHIAASEGSCKMAEVLLEAGASVLSKDKYDSNNKYLLSLSDNNFACFPLLYDSNVISDYS